MPDGRRDGAWVIFHVPHDATSIPADVLPQFKLGPAELRGEILRMTDHRTRDLFSRGVDAAQVICAPVSRLVVDVERYEDDRHEPMAARGMGVVYQHTSDNQLLRHPMDDSVRQALINAWYRPHHERLTAAVHQAVERHGRALLIDAHSFSSKPLPYEVDQRTDRPEICIGTDHFHTPQHLQNAFVEAFRRAGFDTRVNEPFEGALVPARYHGQDSRVSAVMVEVNRGLYLNEGSGEPSEAYEEIAKSIRQCIDRAIATWCLPKAC